MVLRGLILVLALASSASADQFRGTVAIDQSKPALGAADGYARFLVVDGVRHPVRGRLGTLLEHGNYYAEGQEVRLRGDLRSDGVIDALAILGSVRLDVEGEAIRWSQLGVGEFFYSTSKELVHDPFHTDEHVGLVYGGERLQVLDVVERPRCMPALWAQVRTADGREGWLDVSSIDISPARAEARVVDGPDGPRLEVEGGLKVTGRPVTDLLRLGGPRSVTLDGARQTGGVLRVERVLVHLPRVAVLNHAEGEKPGSFVFQDREIPAGHVVGFYFTYREKASVVDLGPEGKAPLELHGMTPITTFAPVPAARGLVELGR